MSSVPPCPFHHLADILRTLGDLQDTFLEPPSDNEAVCEMSDAIKWLASRVRELTGLSDSDVANVVYRRSANRDTLQELRSLDAAGTTTKLLWPVLYRRSPIVRNFHGHMMKPGKKDGMTVEEANRKDSQSAGAHAKPVRGRSGRSRIRLTRENLYRRILMDLKTKKRNDVIAKLKADRQFVEQANDEGKAINPKLIEAAQSWGKRPSPTNRKVPNFVGE